MALIAHLYIFIYFSDIGVFFISSEPVVGDSSQQRIAESREAGRVFICIYISPELEKFLQSSGEKPRQLRSHLLTSNF